MAAVQAGMPSIVHLELVQIAMVDQIVWVGIFLHITFVI